MRWQLRDADGDAVQKLASDLTVSPLVARLLILRGLSEPQTANQFLHPDLDHLYDPLQMHGMQAAVQRILLAVERQERILIYGDYDVDGSLAVVILQTALK